MMSPITQDDALYALEPWLGRPLLLRNPALGSDVALHLNRFFCEKDEDGMPAVSLDELRTQLESLLFNSVYTATGGTMKAIAQNGQPIMIRTQQLPVIADALMDLIFYHLPINEPSFELLNTYAMHHTSLPAMRRLYLDYGAYMPPMNRDIFRRVIVENFGPEAYGAWLK